MMRRDPALAAGCRFDLLVIGGGIYGAALAQQAARRGLATCVCEAADFGGGASWNSLRIVHGGLRHLQTLDVPRFLHAVRARRGLARMFPSLLQPLSCLMPLYGQGLKRRSVMRLAMSVNDALSGARNVGVQPALHISPGRLLDTPETLHAFPLARASGLQGAAVWGDLLMLSSERVVIELLRDACRHGAVVLNYARVSEIRSSAGAVCGVRVHDAIGDGDFEVAARAVADCSGARIGALNLDPGHCAGLFTPSLAFNLLLDRPAPSEYALAVAAPGRRMPVLFLVPLRTGVLAGTMHTPRTPGTVDAQPGEGEIEAFLAMLNAAIPGFDARRAQVARIFAGLLPVTAARSVELVRSTMIVDHGRAGGPRGLFSVGGVKFSTAIEDARRALAVMGWGVSKRELPETPLHISDATPLLINGDSAADADPVGVASTLERVIEEESVYCVDDLVSRRSNWGSTGSEPAGGAAVSAARAGLVRHCASLVASEAR